MGPRDRGLVVKAAFLPQPGPLPRITLARQDRVEDRQPRDAGDVRQHLLQLEVPLRQRLLHVTEVFRGELDEQAALPQVGAQHTRRVVRTKRRRQQPVGVQLLQPRAIRHATSDLRPGTDLSLRGSTSTTTKPRC